MSADSVSRLRSGNMADRESVWDYPRPPRVEDCSSRITVVLGGRTIVDTRRAKRVLETSHPPVYYVPVGDVGEGTLQATRIQSQCEWKGVARYYDVCVGQLTADRAAWGYESPRARFQKLRDHVAFYSHLMDSCSVDGEAVQAQAGGFYGGWITCNTQGPFKGQPGSQGW